MTSEYFLRAKKGNYEKLFHLLCYFRGSKEGLIFWKTVLLRWHADATGQNNFRRDDLDRKAPLSSEVATTCALTVQEILSALTIAISSSKCLLYICTQSDLVYTAISRKVVKCTRQSRKVFCGWFDFTVLQRNLKEWHRGRRRLFANAKGKQQ